MESQSGVVRIKILGVPVDILPPDKIEEVVYGFEDGKNHQIILLSLWDLMRARRPGEFRTMILGASLVIPISFSITRGARFLRRTEPVRYTPFEFVVRLLSALETRGRSLYLLGSTRSVIQKTEANIKATFPGLRVVGRYAGRYPRQMEFAIIEAVRKATPSLLLVGTGIPGRERWIPRNLSRFNSGIYLWCSDLFEVLASKRRRASQGLSRRGLEWIPHFLKRPWKIYRIFIYLWYCVLLLVARLRGD